MSRFTLAICITFAGSLHAEESLTGREAIAAYARAWKANRALLPPLQAELKIVTRNYDVKVSEVKTTTLDNGAVAEFRRDPESTNLYRVFRDAQRMRVTAITPAGRADLLGDLLVIDEDWKTAHDGVLFIRRRDQIGGCPSVDPYDLQSPGIRFDSPDQLDRNAASKWVTEICYSTPENEQGRLEIKVKFESESIREVIDYDLHDGMVPIRYRQYLNGEISSDQSLEYQSVGQRGGKICVKRLWRMRPEGKNSLAGEPKSWYTELTYELTKLREMTAEEMKVAFAEDDFQAGRVSDLRAIEP